MHLSYTDLNADADATSGRSEQRPQLESEPAVFSLVCLLLRFSLTRGRVLYMRVRT